jgi:hypothetical protein
MAYIAGTLTVSIPTLSASGTRASSMIATMSGCRSRPAMPDLRPQNSSEMLRDLDRIDWEILQDRDFSRDNNDLGKMERYQAETLVHRHLPIDSLLAIACYNNHERDRVDALVKRAGLSLKVIGRPGWYF